MNDSFRVAVAYGIVTQAEVLTVNMNLYEAGGYENLPKHFSQLDDCMAGGVDAIVAGAISGYSRLSSGRLRFPPRRKRGEGITAGACATCESNRLAAGVPVEISLDEGARPRVLERLLGRKPDLALPPIAERRADNPLRPHGKDSDIRGDA